METAPIIFFVYNRPWHTEQTLNALMENEFSDQSVLYIYADGPKENADESTLNNIKRTREVIKSKKWCKEVIILERENNLGLANSIINGVTDIVNKYGKVIVLEDDIITSKGFLTYMNNALSLYANESNVGCIHGWNYNLDTSDYNESTFFLKGADCWGWATWERAWILFNPDGSYLLNYVLSQKLEYKFNRNGTHAFVSMLKDQINGKNNSWAIRWHASLFLANKFCLQPTKAIVKNIGMDNSGIHCGYSDIVQNCIDYIEVNKIKVQESEWFFTAYASSLKRKDNNIKINKFCKIKNLVKAFVPPIIVIVIRKLKNQIVVQDIWSGDYASWDEAKKKCTGYDTTLILEKCKNALLKVKNGEAVYERDSVLFDQIDYSFGLLAGLQRAALENNGNLCVLDFGGSLGSTYYQNKGFLNSVKSLQWCIVEQLHFVDSGKKNFENDQLKFYYDLEECMSKHKPNVLILSSVLQYLEKPYEWIEKILGFDISYIIIDRTAFTDADRDILTIQKVPEVIYEASYPAWFFGNGVLNKFTKKYKILARFDNGFTKPTTINSKYKVFWNGIILKK